MTGGETDEEGGNLVGGRGGGHGRSSEGEEGGLDRLNGFEGSMDDDTWSRDEGEH